MMPDNNAPPGQDPVPATLLPDRRATIQFDGLILGAYDEDKKTYQAGVHIQAEHHHVVLTVVRKEDNQPLFPVNPDDWDGSHERVQALAPFWMFVDSGNGLQPGEADATLYNLDDPKDPLSFGKVFNFEKLYDRALQIDLDRLAVFNFPNGTSYSALNTNAQLDELPARAGAAVPPPNAINVSTLGAIDIDQVGGGEIQRDLVFVSSKRAEPFFRLPLVPEATYEIKVLNVPEAHVHPAPAPAAPGHTHPPPVPAEQHFLQYYELFALKPGEDKFVVSPAVGTNFGSTDSPPCIGGAGSTKGGLSGGGG